MASVELTLSPCAASPTSAAEFGNSSGVDACFGCGAYADTDASLLWHVAVFAAPDPGSVLSAYTFVLDAPSRVLSLNTTADDGSSILPEIRTGSIPLYGTVAYEIDVTSALLPWRNLTEGPLDYSVPPRPLPEPEPNASVVNVTVLPPVPRPMTLRVTLELPELTHLLTLAALDIALVREPCADEPGDYVTVAALARGDLQATTLPAVRLLQPDPLLNNSFVATIHACTLQVRRPRCGTTALPLPDTPSIGPPPPTLTPPPITPPPITLPSVHPHLHPHLPTSIAALIPSAFPSLSGRPLLFSHHVRLRAAASCQLLRHAAAHPHKPLCAQGGAHLA